jgi:hypothetical protein
MVTLTRFCLWGGKQWSPTNGSHWLLNFFGGIIWGLYSEYSGKCLHCLREL